MHACPIASQHVYHHKHIGSITQSRTVTTRNSSFSWYIMLACLPVYMFMTQDAKSFSQSVHAYLIASQHVDHQKHIGNSYKPMRVDKPIGWAPDNQQVDRSRIAKSRVAKTADQCVQRHCDTYCTLAGFLHVNGLTWLASVDCGWHRFDSVLRTQTL